MAVCAFICSVTTLSYGTTLELQNHDQLLNVHNVEVQPTRIFDILTTFRTTLHDQSRSSLLLFAESLRVHKFFSSIAMMFSPGRHSQTRNNFH